jgi:hypothetical protein
MKHEIIYTDDYALIVSNQQIKDVRPFMGQYHLEDGLTINKFPNYLTDLGACKLIIAHRPLTDAPILKGVPLLPEFSEDDVLNNLVGDYIKKEVEPVISKNSSQDYRIGAYGGSDIGFRKGYNKVKETYKYTEEDLMNLVQKGHEIYNEGLGVATDAKKQKLINFIQSLQQPKRPKYFECEMTQYTVGEMSLMPLGTINQKQKTITNPQGQTELVGEYTY